MSRTMSHGVVASLGQYGSIYVDDTVEHTGDFIAFQVLNQATFTTLDGSMEDVEISSTFPPDVYTGKFSRVQLAAGKVILYKGGGSL